VYKLRFIPPQNFFIFFDFVVFWIFVVQLFNDIYALIIRLLG